MLSLSAPDHGVLFVVSGPSGVGKSTLLRHVFDRVPGLAFSVSATTRAPRPGETDGVEYHFVDPAAFAGMVARGELLEHAMVYAHGYGTPRAPVEAALRAGGSMVLDIDTQGAAQVRSSYPAAVSVFILPPARADLERRLRARGTDPEDVIQRRIRQADLQLAGAGDYDYLVLNDDLTTASATLEAVFLAELCRRSRRQSWLDRVGPANGRSAHPQARS